MAGKGDFLLAAFRTFSYTLPQNGGRVLGLSQSGEDLNPQTERLPCSPASFNNIYAAADALVDEGRFLSRRMKRLFR